MRRWIFIMSILFTTHTSEAGCVGRFVNPISDICWECIFPITLGGMKIMAGGEDTENPKQLICVCQRTVPATGVEGPMPGIPISFWEPVRLVDVTRTPFCLVNMGGLELMKNTIKGHGTVGHQGHPDTSKQSFYQVHWYVYPLIHWLELLTDFVCLEKTSFDVAYITELDPLWDDDEYAFIMHPEAVLFGNPIAQLACAADCVSASTGFPNDALFWCGGCQGSLYPFTGTVAHHVGGVQASQLLTQRMIAKLHRMGVADGTSGKEGLCDKYLMPIIKKTQYKLQMTYPIPSTQKGCHPLGRTETLWASGREYPYQGEDFGYLVWRKRNCCLF